FDNILNPVQSQLYQQLNSNISMTVDSGADHFTIAIIRQAPKNYSVTLLDNQAEWSNSTDLTNLEVITSSEKFAKLCIAPSADCVTKINRSLDSFV
ncbi:9483_t:CDS:1, partial [Cetraspora pellucida]